MSVREIPFGPLFILTLIGGALYVLAHFVVKYW